MKKKLLLCLMLSFAFTVSESWAQERTVSGTVTSAEDGSTLPGVNVVLKGTTTGTVTDFDGNYTVNMPSEGGTLVFTFVGLATQEINVGTRTVVDVQMQSDAKQLTEVVVTAQGIQREKRALGYAVASVGGESLQRRPINDVGQLLQGQVSGVSVTQTSGTAGGGTNMIIRGYTTITGSNQPLFIVDGVPFNSNTNAQSGFTGGSLNSGSRFLDLDPNNIASIEVLKGLSASVLYGEQGKNGVVLVTTKSGSSGAETNNFQASVTQGVFASKIASLPEYQNTYGNGWQQYPAFYFSNWGADVRDVTAPIAHPYSEFRDPALKAAFPEFQGAEYEYKAYDNVDKFFGTGMTTQTSVSVSGGNQNTRASTTASYVNEEGFMPNNTLKKINWGVGVDSKLTDKFRLNATMNLAITESEAPPLGASNGSSAIGSGSAFYANILYTPRSVDLNGLPWQNPVTGGSVFYRSGNDIPNPNWVAEYTKATSNVQRVSGKMTMTYDILDNLSVTYRGGYDTYYEYQEYIVHKGIGSGPENSVLDLGLYRTTHIRNSIWDHTGLLNYNQDFSEDVSFDAMLGVNARLDQFRRDGLESTGQNTFGVAEHANFLTASPINSFAVEPTNLDMQQRIDQNLYAVYGVVNVGYKDWLYFSGNVRSDWSSTVESANQNIVYPGASLSFIPTEAFDFSSNVLNYVKVRFGYGESAGFPTPYRTRSYIAANAQAFRTVSGSTVSANLISPRLGTRTLQAERHKEFEAGLEAKFWDNRISFDGSVYSRTTDDLIQDADLDPSTGYEVTLINAGRIKNEGVEIGLNANLLRYKDFSWDLGLNFFAYETTVESLAPEYGLNLITLSTLTNVAVNAMVPGEPFGVLYGTVAERVEKQDNPYFGQIVIDQGGDYVEFPERAIIGDPNPDFTLNGNTSLSWKGFTLAAQVEYRKGGDIFSVTAGAVLGRGLGADVGFNREVTVVLPGVNKNTDGTYEPNNVQTTTTNMSFNSLGFGPQEFKVYDGTTLRLREVSLSYNLPKSVLEATPFNGVSVSLNANNMWFKAVNFPEKLNFDTDVLGTGVGNGLGVDYLTGPSAKRYGGTIKLTF